MHDITLAWRQLAKAPAFTLVAVLSLALGIGANTAIFTLVNDLLLRSLPVQDPDALVLFRAVHGAQGRMSRRGEGPGSIDPVTGRNSGTPFSLLIFERLREQRATGSAPLADVFAYAPFSQVHVLVDGIPETAVSAQFVSGTYYSGLGVPARLGRTLTADDDRASAPPAAVISHRFWEQRFAGDPAVLGRTIVINREPATIVGVTPRGFDGAMQVGETADVSVSIAHHARFQPDRADRAQPWYWWVRIMGRLAPGATSAQARAALEPAFQRAAREGWLAGQAIDPSGAAMPDAPLLAADPGAQGENDMRRGFARSLRILMGLVALVLIAACANVANLLIARGSARRREIAVRLALGAPRRRIVRQLLTEALCLAAAGAAVGIVLARGSRDLLHALLPSGDRPLAIDLPLDGRVLAFTLGAAIVTALVFGLVPALRASRVDLIAEFQGGGRALRGGGRSRLGHAFMVIQVALSLVLLVSTGLFVRTVSRLQEVDPGFDARNLLLFRVDATSAGYAPDESLQLHARMQQRLAALPGVREATFSRVALLAGRRQNMSFSIPDMPPSGKPPAVETNGLAPNFFEAMKLPLVLGRAFSERDDEAALRVAVVNQAFVRAYLGEGNPIGRSIQFSAPSFRHRVEIVGVARDAKYTGLRGAMLPAMYFPARQQPDGQASFALRTDGDPRAAFAAVRAAVRAIDPMLPVLDLRTQTEQIARITGQERLFARLSGAFGLTALSLACVGLYGLLSHGVSRRAGEIGLRMALGARPGQMLRTILRESLTLVSLGVALGLAAAYASGSLVKAMLFGVTPADPLTYAGVALLLIGTALVASLLPAYRASRMEPLNALRTE